MLIPLNLGYVLRFLHMLLYQIHAHLYSCGVLMLIHVP